MRLNNSCKITVQKNVYIYAVFMILLMPLRWLFAWMLAVILHEMFHYLFVWILGGKVYEIILGINGIKMSASELEDSSRLIAIIAGPIGGMIPICFAKFFPELAICCLILSVYNLLPLPFLDGGHVLAIFIANEKNIKIIEFFVLGALSVVGFLATFFWGFGIFPMVFVLTVWFRRRKKPCKQGVL